MDVMTLQVGLRELYVNVKRGDRVGDRVIDCVIDCVANFGCDIFASSHIVIKLLVAVKYIHTNHIGYFYYNFTFLPIL